jgi:hypothetical protein
VNTIERIQFILAISGAVIGFFGLVIPQDNTNRIILAIIILILFPIGIFWDKIVGTEISIKIGKPAFVKNGVQFFISREDSPFDEAISKAKEKIGFLSISHVFALKEKSDVIIGAIFRNLEITILLLNPNSDIVKPLENNFNKSTTNLKNDIEESKKLLLNMKNLLPEDKKHLLIIKEHTSDIGHSLMVVDSNNEKSWIKIEEYVRHVSPTSRLNKIVCKKDNIDYWDFYNNEFNTINKKSIVI